MYGVNRTLCSHSDICFQDKEYDSWGAVADYVFQVVPVCLQQARHSTFLVEELRRNIRIVAP